MAIYKFTGKYGLKLLVNIDFVTQIATAVHSIDAKSSCFFDSELVLMQISDLQGWYSLCYY